MANSGAITTGAQTFSGAKTWQETPVGTAGTGASLLQEKVGVNKTTVKLDATLALTDEAGVVAYTGRKVFTFPTGNIMILGATLDATVEADAAGVNADFDGDVGVGVVTASNNATLASTEQNIIPTTAIPQAVDSASTLQATSTASVIVDGTGTPVPVYLNILVDDADHDVTSTPTNLDVDGDLTIYWVNLGSY